MLSLGFKNPNMELYCSTYNMVILNVERWLSLIFPGSNLSITINDRSLGWLITHIYMDTFTMLVCSETHH